MLAYLVLDWASYVYPIVPLGITPLNPSVGLGLFFLIRRGPRPRYWPMLFAAALLTDGLSDRASLTR